MTSVSLNPRSSSYQVILDNFFADSSTVGYEAAFQTRQHFFVSRNIEVLLGYTASEFLQQGTFWQNCIHPDDRLNVFNAWATLTVGNGRSLQYRLRHSEGHYCWVRDDLRLVQRVDQQIILGTWIDISEQESLRQTLVEKEAALAHSQDLTQKILDAIAYPIFIKDENHHFAFVNQALNDFMGINFTEMLGKTDYDCFSQTQADIFRTQDLQVRQQNQAVHFDQIVIDPRGEEHFLWTTKNCFEADQKYLLGVVRDVIQAKKIELSLQQSLNRYQRIADSVPGMIYQFYRLVNREYRASFVNSFCQNIYEVSAEQAIADVGILIGMAHPEDVEAYLQSIEDSAQNLSKWEAEWRIITPSGKMKWLQGISQPEQLDNGDIIWDGIVIDISARKQAEEALQQSHNRFEKVANNVPGMLYQLLQLPDGSLTMPYVNSHCAKIFEYSQAEAIANVQPLFATTHPDDFAGLIASIETSYKNQTKWQHEWRMTTPSGQEKWLQGMSEPELLPNGTMLWDGFIFDISEQQATLQECKFAEQQLIYSRELKSVVIEIFQDLLRNKDPKFHDILRKIGAATASNRVFLICHSDPQRGSIVAHEWFDDTNTTAIGQHFQGLEFDPDSWWMTQITQNRDIICNSREDFNDDESLPLEAKSLRKRLKEAGINSLVAVPIMDNQKQIWGVICLGLNQWDQRIVVQEDAEVLRIVGEMLYMTAARQHQQQQLQESEAKFREIFDNAGVGIVKLDDQFCFIEVNPAFAAMLKQNPNDFLGQSFWSIITDDQTAGDRPLLKIDQTSKIKGFAEGEQCLHNSFGQKIWVKTRFSQMLSQTQEIYYVAVVEDITSQKRSGEISKALLLRNDSLLLALGEVIYDHYLPEDILNWEGNYEEILGYSGVEIGHDTGSWLDRVHPNDLAAVVTEFNRAMTEDNNLFDVEYRFRLQDGSYRWMHDRGVMQEKRNGKAERFIGVMRDIGDRKTAEQRILASEQRYRNIVETAQEGIWVLDEAALTTYVNPQMAEMLGYRPEEMLHKSLFDFIDQTKQQQVKWQFNSGKQGYGVSQDFCFQHRDGSEVWTMISTNPLSNDEGDFLGVLGMITNVSDRRRAEQEVMRNRDLREAIFNESADAIFLVDSVTGLVFDCNQKAVEMFEVSNKSELINIEGHILQRYQFTEPELEAIVTEIKATGQWSCELEYVTKTKRIFWGHIAVKNITVAGRNMNFVRVTDIDQHKRTEQQLRQTNAELERATRLKDQFLANMSHELRTPLNAVLGLSEVLQEQVYGEMNERQRRSLQTIERNGKHLLELINDVLNLSKIEAGHFIVNLNSVSIKQICDASLRLVSEQINDKQQKLQIHYPDISPIIQGDELRLRQVLINLLSNAIKFTAIGGEIQLSITLEPETQQLSIHVADNGIGIDEQSLDKLFQPFVQLDSSLTRRFTGTGLGLALVRRIAELHQGSVSVTSTLGNGSQFSIHLPWQPTDFVSSTPKDLAILERSVLQCTAPKSVSKFEYSDKKQSQPLLLIADDDDDNIETMWDYFISHGYRLIRAVNGKEAIKLVQEHRPDLVLMDIQMPEMDGLTAIIQLRKSLSKEELPIIALTALAMNGDQQKCLDSGANLYITKPCRLKIIEEHIQSLTH